MDLYVVVVYAICPNGMEDVRSFNELTMDGVTKILSSLGPMDTATVRKYTED